MIKDNLQIKGQPTLILRDKNGKIKPLWEENVWGKKVSAFLKRHWPQSKLAIRGLRLPFLGRYVERLAITNLIVNGGKAMANSRLFTDTNAHFSYLAVGSGATSPSGTQTTLVNEITSGGLARTVASYTVETQSVANDMGVLTNKWDVTVSSAVREVGIFNAASGGTMLGRQTFPEINVANGDTLELIYKVIFS